MQAQNTYSIGQKALTGSQGGRWSASSTLCSSLHHTQHVHIHLPSSQNLLDKRKYDFHKHNQQTNPCGSSSAWQVVFHLQLVQSMAVHSSCNLQSASLRPGRENTNQTAFTRHPACPLRSSSALNWKPPAIKGCQQATSYS
jgi:hypothetical protein